MKIIIAILSIGLTISSAIGSPKSFDSNLPKPHFTEKDTNDSVVELGKLLNRDEAGEFFKRAKTEFERICALESSEEDSKTFL